MVPSKVLPVEEIVRDYALRLRLARSAELALAGSLLNAEEVLMPNGKLPETAQELDLLARILVKQRRYAEAQKRWVEALRISKEKACYQNALDSLESYMTAQQRDNRTLLLITSIVIVILVAILACIVIKQLVFSLPG